ncbi:hypothetical protein ASL22_09685 [Alcaligenes faecalis]|nr:hypothetical protein ASL22_09685 [Alcaligenes faecalis]
MVALFKDPQKLANVVRQMLDLLTESNLYNKENGLPIEQDTPRVSIENVTDSNVSIGSSNVLHTVKSSTAAASSLRPTSQFMTFAAKHMTVLAPV